MQETLFKVRYFERGLSLKTYLRVKKLKSKKVKNLTLFILSNPVPFNGQDYEKQTGPGTSDPSLFSGYKTSSEKFLY